MTYLHRGRAFERWFEVAEHIKVSGAGLTNGLLSIELVRDVTEEKKPRNISISSRAIEHKKAAWRTPRQTSLERLQRFLDHGKRSNLLISLQRLNS